jgi:hypothetical protein
LTSCEKEKDDLIEGQINEKSITYSLDNVPLIYYSDDFAKSSAVTNIHKLMENPDDADDEKINKYLYELSLATRDLIKNPKFNQVIISLAQNSETDAANLLDLETVAPQFFTSINVKLAAKGLTLQSIADELTHAPIAPNPDYPETAIIEHYVPAIFIPYLDRINASLQPIISPNIEIDSRFDESIEDNIIAWFFEKATSTTVSEIILSEGTSLNTSNPIFLLYNAVTTLRTAENKTATPLISKGQGSSAGSSAGTLSFSSHEHSIESQSYRYEPWNSGKSEFAVNAYRIEPNGTIHWIYNNTNDNSKVINEIKKNEIGWIRYTWSHHAANWQPWSNPWTPTVTQSGVNMVFWNTYERDWNRSSKALGTCSANGSTIYLAGRKKYDSEWYAWIPSTANIHYTRIEWIYDNWAHWNNSWKSQFSLWRVHI